MTALRISAWCGGASVGALSAGGEEHAEAVVGEIAVAVGEAAGLLDEQVDRFGAAVGQSGGVEVGQHLRAPGPQGPAESGDLGDWAAGEAGDDLLGQRPPCDRWAGAGVDGAQLLVAGPGELDLASRVSGVQAGGEPLLLAVGQVFGAVPQQPADPVERVVLVAAAASLSPFPCKPRMMNAVSLSRGESSGEEDDECVERCFPAVGSGSRFSSSFAGDVAESEVEELHRGVVGWEVSTGLGDLP